MHNDNNVPEHHHGLSTAATVGIVAGIAAGRMWSPLGILMFFIGWLLAMVSVPAAFILAFVYHRYFLAVGVLITAWWIADLGDKKYQRNRASRQ